MSRQLERLIQALSDPAVYPHCPDSVQVVQTHISVVFIAGTLVYKVKKPLNFGFLDFTTLEKRRHFCNQEVILNSRFSEGIYLGVISICEGPHGINLEGQGEEIESAVLMRHIPEERLLIQMLHEDKVTPEILDRLADRIAAFHSRAATGPEIASFGSMEVIYHNLTENFHQARPYIGRTIDAQTHQAISSHSLDFLRAHEDLITDRMKRGYVRDCHGDLHVDHVVILDGIMLIDCIEFNDRFRYCDTASDLGFLLMDLDFLGYPALGKRIAERYAASAGDEHILKLLGFYKSYRAFVRGKVLGFTLDEPEVTSEEKESATETARQYFQLSLACLQPPPPPVLVITTGLTGSGKSFVADRLGKRLGIAPLRSDVLRKEIHGLGTTEHRLDKFGEGIYTPKATEQTYRLLLEKARRAVERGESVILDASFMRFQDRMDAGKTARRAGARFRIIECIAPHEVLRQRLEARMADPREPSDGRWEIFQEQRERFEPIRPEEREDSRTWDSTTDVNTFLASFVRELATP